MDRHRWKNEEMKNPISCKRRGLTDGMHSATQMMGVCISKFSHTHCYYVFALLKNAPHDRYPFNILQD